MDKRTTHAPHLSEPNARGFTLIELLVVIAIIGVLSSVIVSALNTARMKSRDAQRLASLRQVERALEVYYTDNQAYPSTGGGWRSIDSVCTGQPVYGDGAAPGLTPDYIPTMPRDPTPRASACFLYRSNGTDYTFMAWNTVESFDPDTEPHPLDRTCCNQQTIRVSSPGGRNW